MPCRHTCGAVYVDLLMFVFFRDTLDYKALLASQSVYDIAIGVRDGPSPDGSSLLFFLLFCCLFLFATMAGIVFRSCFVFSYISYFPLFFFFVSFFVRSLFNLFPTVFLMFSRVFLWVFLLLRVLRSSSQHIFFWPCVHCSSHESVTSS